MSDATALTIFAIYFTLLNVAVIVGMLLHATGLQARIAHWLDGRK